MTTLGAFSLTYTSSDPPTAADIAVLTAMARGATEASQSPSPERPPSPEQPRSPEQPESPEAGV